MILFLPFVLDRYVRVRINTYIICRHYLGLYVYGNPRPHQSDEEFVHVGSYNPFINLFFFYFFFLFSYFVLKNTKFYYFYTNINVINLLCVINSYGKLECTSSSVRPSGCNRQHQPLLLPLSLICNHITTSEICDESVQIDVGLRRIHRCLDDRSGVTTPDLRKIHSAFLTVSNYGLVKRKTIGINSLLGNRKIDVVDFA